MQIFDELKVRGVQDLGFLSMDSVAGLEEGAKAIFPKVVTQRCIVHLIRNSVRYIPRKSWASFTKQLKTVYGAVNVEAARQDFAELKNERFAYLALWLYGKIISTM